MTDKLTVGAAASLIRKRELKEAAVRAEAGQIFERDFSEKFTPTSKAERKAAAVSFTKQQTFAGIPVLVTNRLTGEKLQGLSAARHIQDVNEARRLFAFQQRTGKDPLAPENRVLPRDAARKLQRREARAAQRSVEKLKRTRRDPFAAPRAPSPPKKRRKIATGKIAKGFKSQRQKRQAPGTARSIVTRQRPRTRFT